MRLKTLLAGLMVAPLLLSGCTLLPESQPASFYQMPPPSIAQRAGEALPLALRINTPQAGFAHSSPRLLVNPQGDQLSSYKGARWTEPLPAMVREHLRRAFVQSGALSSVSSDEHALHADVLLGSDLLGFQVVYRDQQPVAIVELEARLIEPAARRVLASRIFRAEQLPADPQVPAVVRAQAAALDQVTRELIDWSLLQLQGFEP